MNYDDSNNNNNNNSEQVMISPPYPSFMIILFNLSHSCSLYHKCIIIYLIIYLVSIMHLCDYLKIYPSICIYPPFATPSDPYLSNYMVMFIHIYLITFLLIAIGVMFCSAFMHVGFSVNVMSVIISLFGKNCNTIVMIIIHAYIHMSLAQTLLYTITSTIVFIHHLHIIYL